MMTAADIAQLDQDRAELVKLVRSVREHHEADACPQPAICPGEPTTFVVCHEYDDDTDPHSPNSKALLLLAAAELARLGYATPTADELAYELTDHGQAVLDECDGGDRA